MFLLIYGLDGANIYIYNINSEFRWEVQKFTLKFTSRFINRVSDWSLNKRNQSNALFTNQFVNFNVENFELRNKVCNIQGKFYVKSTVIIQYTFWSSCITLSKISINPLSTMQDNVDILAIYATNLLRVNLFNKFMCLPPADKTTLTLKIEWLVHHLHDHHFHLIH